jgi:uncharacterized protein YjbJ (UPF0337 family)
MARALISAPPGTASAAGLRRKDADKATGNKRLRAKGKAGEVAGQLKLKGEKAKGAFKR